MLNKLEREDKKMEITDLMSPEETKELGEMREEELNNYLRVNYAKLSKHALGKQMEYGTTWRLEPAAQVMLYKLAQGSIPLLDNIISKLNPKKYQTIRTDDVLALKRIPKRTEAERWWNSKDGREHLQDLYMR